MTLDTKPHKNGIDHSTQDQSQLARVLDAYLADIEAGRGTDPETLIQAHPHLADRLRACLSVLQLANQVEAPTSLTTPIHPAINTRLGDFQILRTVGRGGMGIVFEAEQLSLHRRVALKILPFAAALDPLHLRRFQIEAQAAAQLHHTNIVPIFSIGCEQGVHYYAMQFIEGQTLANLISNLQGRPTLSSPYGGERPTLSPACKREVGGSSDDRPGSHAGPSDAPPCKREVGGSSDDRPGSHAGPSDAPPCKGGVGGGSDDRPGSHAGPSNAPPCKGGVGGGSDECQCLSIPQNLPRKLNVLDKVAVDGGSSSPSIQTITPTIPPTIHTPAHFQTVARLGQQAAEGLHHAHQLGVIHRDIKPSNLLIDTRGTLWITDFGLARIQSDSTLTMTGDIIGTLRYMSPEQSSGGQTTVDHRADIYSLGATLYELATLHPVHHSPDRATLIRQMTLEEPTPPRKHNRAIPKDLETTILKALTKDPAHRYPTAQALAEDLHRFQDHRPIQARRPTIWKRAQKWTKRHKALTALAIVVPTILAIATTIVAHQKNENQKQLQENQRLDRLTKHNQYVQDIRQAFHLVQQNALEEAKRLLDRHIPQPGQPDDRSFPWHYLWRVVNFKPKTWEGHKGDVYHVQYSPNGKILASSGQDGTVLLRDAATGEILQTLRGHNGDVNYISFSPDGKTLATGGDDGTVRLWNAADVKPITTLGNHNGYVISTLFTPDGLRLVSAGRNGDVKVWDVKTHHLTGSIPRKPGPLEEMAISPDGKMLATAGNDHIAQLWNLDTLRLVRTLPGPGVCQSVVFSHNGLLFAAAGDQGSVCFWDMPKITFGDVLAEPYPGGIQCMAFSPDDRTLAVCGRDASIQLWDMRHNKLRTTYRGPKGGLWRVTFSPDGRSLITTALNGRIDHWDISKIQDQERIDIWTYGYGLDVSPNHSTVRSLVRDDHRPNTFSIASFDIKHRQHNRSAHYALPGQAEVGALSLDGESIALLDNSDRLTLWRAEHGELDLRFTIPVANTDFKDATSRWKDTEMRFSPDARRLAIFRKGDEARFIDTTIGQRIHPPQPLKLDTLLFSPSEDAVIGIDGPLLKWNIVTQKIQIAEATTSEASRMLTLRNDGQIVVTASGNNIDLWNASILERQSTLTTNSAATHAAAFSPDGQILASAANDGNISLWDVASGQHIGSLQAHFGNVGHLWFSDDGSTLHATGPQSARAAFPQDVSSWSTSP